MFEVEIRGRISNEKIRELKGKYNFKKTKERIVVMYFRGSIPEDIRETLNDPVDLRVKISKKGAKLSLKYGTFSDVSREEIEMNVDKSEVLKLIDILKYLGWKIAVVYATEAWEAKIDGVTFNIVRILKTPYNFFEAEIVVEREEEVEKAKEKLISFVDKLGLTPFKDEEFYDFCNAVNSIEEFQFDFSKDDPRSIFDLFPQFK